MPETTTRVIKKYQNRKLYDTKDSCYITLEEIAQLIKHGEDISVVDNKTKADVTSVILTQILVDQEKSKKSTLPISMLKNIIKGGTGSLYEFIQRYVITRTDSHEDAMKEAERYLNFLTSKGEITEAEARSILEEFNRSSMENDSWSDELARRLDETLKNVPNFADIQHKISELYKKMEMLEQRLSALEKR